jgi:hypothetical protein
MREEQVRDERDDLVDLGAACEQTRGPWDPQFKETHVLPESFPM